jgi:hypothetical protein
LCKGGGVVGNRTEDISITATEPKAPNPQLKEGLMQFLFLGVAAGALYVAVYEMGKREGARLLAEFMKEKYSANKQVGKDSHKED